MNPSPLTRHRRALAPLCFALVPALLAPSALPGQDAAPPAAKEAAAVQPLAYLKVSPLQKLFPKLIKAAGSIDALQGAQLALMTGMAGGMLGDPGLASVSPDHDLTAVVLDDFGSGPPPIVFAVRLTEDSPIKAKLAEFGLVSEDHGGWTLVAQSKAVLKKAGGLSVLSEVGEINRESDLQLGLLAGSLLERRGEQIHAMAMGGIAAALAGQPDQVGNLTGLAGVLLKELGEVDSLAFGVGFGDDAIALQSTVHARQGTGLAKALHQEVDGPVEAAKWIPQTGMFSFVMRIDPEASSGYFDRFLGRLAGATEGPLQAALTELQTVTAEAWKMGDGTAAGTVDVSEGGRQVDVLQAGGANVTEEQWVGFMKRYNEAIFNQLMDAVPFLGELGIKYEHKFSPAVKQVDGVNVHQQVVKMTFSPEKFGALPPGLAPPEGGGSPLDQTQNYLYAVVGKSYLAASTDAEMAALIKAAKAGKPVAGSLSAAIVPVPGAVMQYTVDLGKYATMVAETMAAAAGDNPEIKAVIDRIKALEMAPLRGEVTAKGGTLRSGLKIPLANLGKIGKLVQEIRSGGAYEGDGAEEPGVEIKQID